MAFASSTMAALQIAGAAFSAIQGIQRQQAQEAANERQYQNSIRAYSANVNQTNLMAAQEREAAMQKLEANNQKARAAQARATTAAGESGISGISVDALLGDMTFDEGQYDSAVMTNYDRSITAINNQRENVYAKASSEINSLKTPEMPDYFGAGLKIYNAGKEAKWWGQA